MGKTTKEKTPANNGETAGMTAWLEIMTGSARFLADRFQQDLETQQAVLGCKKPDDLLRLQSEFYRRVIEQYTSEANRMTQLLTKATMQTMGDVRTVQARGYDDLPL